MQPRKSIRYPEAEHLIATGVRRLKPETTRLYLATFGLLHCEVKDDTLYRGVFPVRMFPIRHPNRYIALRYTDHADDKEKEIGVIEELIEFSDEQQELIRQSLNRQYYEQVIQRVFKITHEYGLLFFEVETQRGREAFTMPWRGDRAEDYGESGKVLLDAHDNRYIISDVQALPAADQLRFTSYIYW